jgi:uncharacterized membrane protein
MKRYPFLAVIVSTLLLSAAGCGPGSPGVPGGWLPKAYDGSSSGTPYVGTVVLIAACVAVYFVVRSMRKKKTTPLDLLKRRYKKGYISAAEFERRKKDLKE